MNFINEYPNFITKETCDILMSTLTANEWDASQPGGSLKAYFTEYGLAAYDDIGNQTIKEVLELVDRKVEQYFEPLRGLVPYTFSRDGFSILKTNSSGVPFHYDSEVLNNDVYDCRCFLVLIYLTDNMKGGELIFPFQKVSITPEVGKLVIFPASFAYPHLVAPYLDEKRLCVRVNYIINKESIRAVEKRRLIEND